MRAALKSRQFRRLFAGVGWTLAGESILLLVLSIWVKDLTGSSAAAGMTFFWLVLPSVLAPLLGWAVDRYPRKKFLAWGNLASILTVAPLLLVRGEEQLWIVYACAFAYGTSFVMLPAALNGLLKLILPPDDLVEGNGVLGTTKEALRIGGPITGAAIYTVAGPHAVIALTIAAYVVAACVIATMDVDGDRVEPTDESTRDSLLIGVRHVRRDPLLLHPLVGVGLALVVFGFSESVMFAIVDAFDRPAAYVGVVVMVQGIGAVAGGVAAAAVIRRIGEAAAIVCSLTLFAISTATIALAPAMWVVLVAVVPTGVGLPLTIIALMTLMQRRTPAPIMGRVSAAFDVILGTPQTISIAVGAGLVTILSYHAIYAVMAATCVTAMIYVYAMAIRKPGRSPAGDGPESGLDVVSRRSR
ncbi:MFS transporter [Solicola gregarius]|uniref:MFS transporter n=1 Tax=Solicola gregarius TaxID=2908642 RepID=A0AA46TL74_9ACTN|nr:MFS transporter [Solicola gregarius]UYM07359.1 MFS transporter [Solicola gregarius]